MSRNVDEHRSIHGLSAARRAANVPPSGGAPS
jgi:hypothetical protein